MLNVIDSSAKINLLSDRPRVSWKSRLRHVHRIDAMGLKTEVKTEPNAYKLAARRQTTTVSSRRSSITTYIANLQLAKKNCFCNERLP